MASWGMRYERLRKLEEGATAETFLSRDLQGGGGLVAQKVFFPEWAAERPDLVDREFWTLSTLSHPFIAAIRDFGEDFGQEAGRPYLVSEFVDGPDLLTECRRSDLNQVVWFFHQLLEALDYLYFRNVVHLDLKPQNVLIQKDSPYGPCVKLIDFGLAAAAVRGTEETLEAIGEAIGTPPFTAPEFALRRSIDTRSDLYSVGALLYTALAGRPPFAGDDPVALLNQQLRKDPAPLISLAPRVPRALSDWVGRLMERDAGKRPANPRVALSALKEAVGEDVPTERVAPVPVFEDPDLVFRKDEARGLLEQVLASEGRWCVEGGDGLGKTFLARWLERGLWSHRKRVLFFQGDRIVLEDEAKIPRDAFLIVDDADRGPVPAWLEKRPASRVILFGRSLSWTRGDAWNRLVLGPLPTAVSPRELIRRERERLGGPVLEEAARRLLSVMGLSRASLDLEALSLWTGLSMSEVEAAIEDLVRQGRLHRRVVSGRLVYDAVPETVPPCFRKDALSSPVPAPAFFQKLYDEGRYTEGLELWDRFAKKAASGDEQILMKARLLSGAGRHEEVFRILTGDFVARLSPLRQAEAWETLGKSLLFSGQGPEDRKSLDKAVSLYAEGGDEAGLARSLMHLGIIAQRLGDFEGAEGFYERALKAATASSQPDLLTGAVGLNLANLYFDAACWERAEPAYRECLKRLAGTAHAAVTAQAHLNLANLIFHQGKLLQAAHEAREALRLAVENRYLLTQGRVLLLLAQIDEARGRRERRGERLSEAVLIFEEGGQAFEKVVALIHRAYFRDAEGNLPAATKDARDALAEAERIKAQDLAAQARLVLGKILGKMGDAEAFGHLEAARRHFAQGRNLQMNWECEFECGEFERTRGSGTEALACYRRALEAVDALTARLPDLAKESFLRDGKRERILEKLS